MTLRPLLAACGLAATLGITSLATANGLHDAIQSHDVAQAKKLLASYPALVNSRDKEGRTPLELAVEDKEAAVLVDALLKAGAAVNAADYEGSTPLLSAAECGNVAMVKTLLAAKADPHAKSHDGDTLLHLAAGSGNMELLNLALAQGIPVNATNDAGKTPLFFAVGDAGPVASMANEFGQLLCKFIELLPDDERAEVKKALADQLIDPTLIVAALLDHGAQVNVSDIHGGTPLLGAVKAGNLELARLLQVKGARTDVRNEDQQTLLHLAAQSASLPMVEWALAQGGDVKAVDDYGNTPLHFATNSAAVNPDNFFSALADAFSSMMGNFSFDDILDQLPEEERQRVAATIDEKTKDPMTGIVTLLVNNGADVTAINHDGNCAVFGAADAGNINSVQFLLAHGATVQVTNEEGATPLHAAATSDDGELVALLCGKGCAVNAVDNSGNTPLLAALGVSNGDDEEDGKAVSATVTTLLANGAAVNVHANDGNTPLHLAAKDGNAATVRLLLAKGAQTTAKNAEGKTPLDLAKARGDAAIIKLLAPPAKPVPAKTAPAKAPAKK